ncbi:MAG: hypothetical protein JNK05_38595 [Myxococcales bacterium]|nr:hypothetical protein [Myxococcales bacterium]
MRVGASISWSCLAALFALTGACTTPSAREDVADASNASDAADTGAPIDAPIVDAGVCRDMDNDGHPSAECGGDDCDDNNPRRNPSAREVCDGAGTDEDCNPCTVAEFSVTGVGGDGDRDEDGYFNQNCFNRIAAGTPAPVCSTETSTDGGVEDGGSSSGSVARVRVSATMVSGTDCADDPATGGASRFPGAFEVCNALDDNCDGTRDEGVQQTFYRDLDGDGFGDRNAMGMADVVMGCSAPMGFAVNNTDCDDRRASINPGAREVCDLVANVDENCSGMAEEDCGCGSVGATRACCSGQGLETCAMTTMGSMWGACSASPSGAEVCNGRDDDCNGTIDEGLRIQCYPDGDGDGYPASNAVSQPVCPDAARPARGNCPVNFTDIAPAPGNVDCNDSASTQAPRLPELCDTIDNDCDATTIDGTTDARVGTSCTGGVGTGRCSSGTNVCTASGIACQRNTAALEMCNAIDDDCDGTTDEPLCVHATFNGAGQQVVTGYGGACVASGQCAITTCVRDRGNCDANNVNGCESNLRTSSDNCGACGVRCLEGSACVDGICTESRAVDVSAGLYLTCFVNNGGRVYCAGLNSDGQLGDGTMISKSAPTLVAGITNATQVSAGAAHACAVRRDGSVLCWGLNTFGQLGDGTRTRRLTPTAVLGLTDAVEVAVGTTHTCARRMDRTLVCWGDNSSGALGDGTSVLRSVATRVLSLTDAVEITAGDGFSCARRANGEVSCWGQNGVGQLGNSTRTPSSTPRTVSGLSSIAEIDAGDAFACARTTSGAIWCWGTNTSGQLATPTNISYRTTATAVAGIFDAAALTAGGSHVCARRSNGRAVCWGFNGSGQLGHTATPTYSPAEVVALRDGVAITAGSNHTCATRTNGQLVCWGNGSSGNLANGAMSVAGTPQVAIGNGIGASIAAGGLSACTRTNTGQILCWGDNSRGQLGDGTTMTRARAALVLSITDATDVQVGNEFACALRVTGGVACWGANNAGQLGNASTLQSSTPVAVMGLTDAVQLAVGSQHACAVRAAGAVVCWGANGARQLGDGTNVNRSVPVSVTGLTGTIDQVTAGDTHSCVRRLPSVDGGAPLFCWGTGANGELGTGTNASLASPSTPVLGGFEWLSVAAGVNFTCGRRANGQVFCWGINMQGQLGDGTSTMRLAPMSAVSGLSDSSTIETGSQFACARRPGGQVACWGLNNVGQLGATLPAARASAVDIAGLSGVTSLASGAESSCVGRLGREVLCWGGNSRLQLGPNFVGASSATPIRISEL